MLSINVNYGSLNLNEIRIKDKNYYNKVKYLLLFLSKKLGSFQVLPNNINDINNNYNDNNNINAMINKVYEMSGINKGLSIIMKAYIKPVL